MTFRPLRSPNPCFRREPRPGRSPPAERAQHVGPYSGSSSDWQDAIADAQRELTAADDADDSAVLLLLQSSIVPLRRSVGWLEPERPH